MKKAVFLLMVFTILSGCASMSPEECKTANWYQVGYLDGHYGNNPNIIGSYAEDCAEVGISPDREKWQQGFDNGTLIYCSPDNGYTVGAEGREYHGVCSSNLFLQNYQLGRQEYERKQRIEELDRQIADIDIQLANKPDKEKKQYLEENRKRLVRERSDLLTPTVNFNLNF
ncbi:DUF2799 domain-containing protein [Vibrio atypicus]|uniref:DUF2799 domain-containing protein n=1 Tax=Vibrio atypicus TaxID=558271 RepID=UPI00135A7F3C|nr:DUF2799 domain-containing protein [Vibrio atypicus]